MKTNVADRELLELAAKAAEIEYDVEASKPHPVSGAWFGLWLVIHGEPNEFTRRRWNPLTDDGDALRLAVKLQIDVYHGTGDGPEIWAGYWMHGAVRMKHACAPVSNDPYAATRRAIVRAAAEIGKESHEKASN